MVRGLLLAWLMLGAPRLPVAGDEMTDHLERLAAQAKDRSIGLPRREQIVLELAATLDRAAQGAKTPDERNTLWDRAVETLESFSRENPGHAQERSFELQEAVYLWAKGRTLAQQAALASDEPGLTRAKQALDLAIGRFESLLTELGPARDLLAQNARYRLAQALVDRGELEATSSSGRRALYDRSMDALDQAVTTASLAGYVHLLRAKILTDLGRLDEAEAAVTASSAASPPPPEADQLKARVEIAVGRGLFRESVAAVEASGLDPIAKDAEALGIRLAERARSKGPARDQAELDAFRRARALRGSDRPEARLALTRLAGEISVPGGSGTGEDFDLLADLQLRLGRRDRAAELSRLGAERAMERGERERAATLRYRSGAILFQSGDYVAASQILGRVADDSSADAVRPKAGLLRAIALGRGLSRRSPGITAAAYTQALETQIRDYPEDPTASEARWLLGGVRMAEGRRADAEKLWAQIPPGHARWLEARLATAEGCQADLEQLLIGADRAEISQAIEATRKAIDAARAEATTDDQRDRLELQKSRYLLTPGASSPELVSRTCERLTTTAHHESLRLEAKRLRVVAQVQLGRYADAERLARELVDGREAPSEDHALLDTAALIDRSAVIVESDIDRRRIGLILRHLTEKIIARVDHLDARDQVEARLRHARALILSGDSREGRRALEPVSLAAASLSDGQLRDLADSFALLDAHDLAVDVQRLRVARLSSGSPAWFEARYGMALGYYRSGKLDQARKIIDTDSILHPDLGGAELRAKFERLRSRLELN